MQLYRQQTRKCFLIWSNPPPLGKYKQRLQKNIFLPTPQTVLFLSYWRKGAVRNCHSQTRNFSRRINRAAVLEMESKYKEGLYLPCSECQARPCFCSRELRWCWVFHPSQPAVERPARAHMAGSLLAVVWLDFYWFLINRATCISDRCTYWKLLWIKASAKCQCKCISIL